MTETQPEPAAETPASSPTAKKTPAKKAPAKKATAKTATAKKATAKTATKKTATKKPATAKTATKKAPAKPVAKKAPAPEPAKRTSATAAMKMAAAVPGSAEAVKQAEASVAMIRELNEKAIAATRGAGQSALDAYQSALEAIVAMEHKLAGSTQVEWVSAMVKTQAEFTQKITKAYLSAARDLLR
jgi:hypothetical protein